MIALDVVYEDGTHTTAHGGSDWIEQSITQIAETGKSIRSYTITDTGA